MGEVQVQSQCFQEQPFITSNSPKQQQTAEVLQLRDSSVESIDLFSMLHLNNAAANSGGATTCCHNRPNSNPPCAAADCGGSPGSNSTKRRSPATPSGVGERSAKKLFCDQEDLTLHGFSAVLLPVSVSAIAGKCAASGAGGGGRPNFPALRRCSSVPSKSTVGELPECVTGGGVDTVTPDAAAGRGRGLPPLPPGLRRTVSCIAPSPAKASSPPDSSKPVKLRRIVDRLKEMKQWCDVALKDAEEGEDEEEEEEEEEKEKEKEELVECGVFAEDDEVPPQDQLGADAEEAISVEWIQKCLSLTFRCPCGKCYEVLLSEDKCYYKLV